MRRSVAVVRGPRPELLQRVAPDPVECRAGRRVADPQTGVRILRALLLDRTCFRRPRLPRTRARARSRRSRPRSTPTNRGLRRREVRLGERDAGELRRDDVGDARRAVVAGREVLACEPRATYTTGCVPPRVGVRLQGRLTPRLCWLTATAIGLPAGPSSTDTSSQSPSCRYQTVGFVGELRQSLSW